MATGVRVAGSNGTVEQKIVYTVSQCLSELWDMRPVGYPDLNKKVLRWWGTSYTLGVAAVLKVI